MVIWSESISTIQCGVTWRLRHSLFSNWLLCSLLAGEKECLVDLILNAISFLYMAKPGATRVWLKAIRLLYKVRTSRMGTLALRGVMMEIIKHIIASGKVSWDIFWKYKNKGILHSDWKAWFDHRKFCVLVELNVLWDCFFLLFKLYFWTVFKTRLYEVAG